MPKKKQKTFRKLLLLDLPMLPVIISILAVLLSQFPPIYTWFSKPDIKVELGTKAMIFDSWGSMVFQPYLLLRNEGAEHGFVKNVTVEIFSILSEYQIGNLPVQTYFEKNQIMVPNSTSPQIPVRFIRISPDSVWSNYVSAWKQVDEKRQDQINSIVSKAEEHFQKNYKIDQVWSMPEDLHIQALDLTTIEQKKIIPGKYLVKVIAIDAEDEVLDEKFYTFTLRDSQVKILTEKLNEYKFGGGVIFPLRKNKIFNTWIDIFPVNANSKLISEFINH